MVLLYVYGRKGAKSILFGKAMPLRRCSPHLFTQRKPLYFENTMNVSLSKIGHNLKNSFENGK